MEPHLASKHREKKNPPRLPKSSVQQYVVGKKPRGLRTVGFGVRAAVLPWPAKSDALPLL